MGHAHHSQYLPTVHIANHPELTDPQAGVVVISTIYATYHLFRAAGGRTPGSSAAYHTFAGITDLCTIVLYAFGALSARNNSSGWGTINSIVAADQIHQYLVPATYYTLIGSGGAHLLSLAISLWLAVMFRRILNMPPDMNPLESHLTARSHKRNKSSVATDSTYADSIEKRLSAPLESQRRSGVPCEDMRRPPTIPFMHTRQGSETSLRTRDSRADLPSRQYQVVAGNSPRHSAASDLTASTNRMSAGGGPDARLTSWRNSYVEVPLHDTASSSRPTTGSRPSTGSYRGSGSAPAPPRHGTPTGPAREPKFTEAWYASESLVQRTQERAARALALGQLNANMPQAGNERYEAVNQRYDDDDDDDDESVSTYSTDRRRTGDSKENDDAEVSDLDDSDLAAPARRPHPLRSNPTSPSSSAVGSRPKTPFDASRLAKGSPLGELSLNDRRVSGSHDIADQKLKVASNQNRKSSIQAESEFFSKPYGSLKPGTPPVMLVGGNRQVSSGNDYAEKGLGASRFSVFGRRNVSGKVVEEGRSQGPGGGRVQEVGTWTNYT